MNEIIRTDIKKQLWNSDYNILDYDSYEDKVINTEFQAINTKFRQRFNVAGRKVVSNHRERYSPRLNKGGKQRRFKDYNRKYQVNENKLLNQLRNGFKINLG